MELVTMGRGRGRAIAAAIVVTAMAACGGVVDNDRDGLDDRLEARLALEHLPVLHEFADGTARDECPQPRQRPIIYRARPSGAAQVAITYVLLYEKDCGALGHDGDSEAFTVFVSRDGQTDRWTTVGATAVAHAGSPAEKVSQGPGRDIWISRNKHGNFARFDDCGDSDIPGDVCAEQGPPAAIYALLNAGEPGARLSDDAGDVMLEAGARTARTPASGAHADAETAHAFLLFRGRSIWDYESFLGAGSLTVQLERDSRLTAPHGGTVGGR